MSVNLSAPQKKAPDYVCENVFAKKVKSGHIRWQLFDPQKKRRKTESSTLTVLKQGITTNTGYNETSPTFITNSVLELFFFNVTLTDNRKNVANIWEYKVFFQNAFVIVNKCNFSHSLFHWLFPLFSFFKTQQWEWGGRGIAPGYAIHHLDFQEISFQYPPSCFLESSRTFRHRGFYEGRTERLMRQFTHQGCQFQKR